MRRALLAVAAVVGMGAPCPAAAGDGEIIERTGDAPVAPERAWREPGFRLRLGAGRESLTPSSEGRGPALDATTILLRPGWRLDDRWLVEAAFRYGVLLGARTGLRWTATGDLTYRVASGSWTDGLMIGLGAGYAGFAVGKRVGGCSAGGAVALIRAGWLWEVTSGFATGPTAQYDSQWTACRVDGRRWGHESVTATWELAWR